MEEKKKIFLTLEQAISLLPDENDIHTFLSDSFGMIGANMNKEELIEKIRGSDFREITGTVSQSMQHGLAVYNKGSKQIDILFVKTDMDKLKKLEEELCGV